MSDTDLKARASEEKKRIIAILKDAGISKRRMDMLKPVIENTAWMKAKLDDARELIRNNSIVIPYDNGGGQRGIREHPAFKGYESLWKAYMQGMNRILDTLPPEQIQNATDDGIKPQTVLDQIRAKHSKPA